MCFGMDVPKEASVHTFLESFLVHVKNIFYNFIDLCFRAMPWLLPVNMFTR